MNKILLDKNPIVVFKYINIENDFNVPFPIFLNYRTKEEIEDKYELFIAQKDLLNYNIIEDIISKVKRERNKKL